MVGRCLMIRRKYGISEAAFYRWRQKYAGMDVAELRRLRVLEDENRKLKKLLADVPCWTMMR